MIHLNSELQDLSKAPKASVMELRKIVRGIQLLGDSDDAAGILEDMSQVVEDIAYDLAFTLKDVEVVNLLCLSAQLSRESEKLR